jgi:hypothetical protein
VDEVYAAAVALDHSLNVLDRYTVQAVRGGWCGARAQAEREVPVWRARVARDVAALREALVVESRPVEGVGALMVGVWALAAAGGAA